MLISKVRQRCPDPGADGRPARRPGKSWPFATCCVGHDDPWVARRHRVVSGSFWLLRFSNCGQQSTPRSSDTKAFVHESRTRAGKPRTATATKRAPDVGHPTSPCQTSRLLSSPRSTPARRATTTGTSARRSVTTAHSSWRWAVRYVLSKPRPVTPSSTVGTASSTRSWTRGSPRRKASSGRRLTPIIVSCK